MTNYCRGLLLLSGFFLNLISDIIPKVMLNVMGYVVQVSE